MNSKRWDNRRSGRTTKMLAAAMRKCYDGGDVYVVIPRGTWEKIVPTLKDLGATYICHAPKMAKFGADARMHFIAPENNAIDRDSLWIKGIKEENTFWDHEAVRQVFNRVLQKYHEYD